MPTDDREALRKINSLQSLHDDYRIVRLSGRDIPDSARHWGYVFFRSKETVDHAERETKGGTIPGLGEYRYSLEWESFPGNFPGSVNLEMNNANGGGTKLRGEMMVGTHDPRLPDKPHITTTVPWTPTELKTIYEDGEAIPNKWEYSSDPPMMDASDAKHVIREHLQDEANRRLDELEEELRAYERECEHEHVIKSNGEIGIVAHCEDCGRGFEAHELEELDIEPMTPEISQPDTETDNIEPDDQGDKQTGSEREQAQLEAF